MINIELPEGTYIWEDPTKPGKGPNGFSIRTNQKEESNWRFAATTPAHLAGVLWAHALGLGARWGSSDPSDAGLPVVSGGFRGTFTGTQREQWEQARAVQDFYDKHGRWPKTVKQATRGPLEWRLLSWATPEYPSIGLFRGADDDHGQGRVYSGTYSAVFSEGGERQLGQYSHKSVDDGKNWVLDQLVKFGEITEDEAAPLRPVRRLEWREASVARNSPSLFFSDEQDEDRCLAGVYGALGFTSAYDQRGSEYSRYRHSSVEDGQRWAVDTLVRIGVITEEQAAPVRPKEPAKELEWRTWEGHPVIKLHFKTDPQYEYPLEFVPSMGALWGSSADVYNGTGNTLVRSNYSTDDEGKTFILDELVKMGAITEEQAEPVHPVPEPTRAERLAALPGWEYRVGMVAEDEDGVLYVYCGFDPNSDVDGGQVWNPLDDIGSDEVEDAGTMTVVLDHPASVAAAYGWLAEHSAFSVGTRFGSAENTPLVTVSSVSGIPVVSFMFDWTYSDVWDALEDLVLKIR